MSLPVRFTPDGFLADSAQIPALESLIVWRTTGATWGTPVVATPVALTDMVPKSYVDQVTINAQVGTSYTHVLSDGGKLITFNNAGAITFTVDSNAHVATPVGTQIQILQLGAGQVTVAITSDTLNATPGLKLRAQFSMATLVKIAATTWVLSGDLSA